MALGALICSLAAHAALLFWLLHQNKSDQPQQTTSASIAVYPIHSPPKPIAAPASAPAALLPPLSIKPHYFYLRELSEKPLVQQDIPADMLLAFPGFAAQTVVLRLFINEEGAIDHIQIEQSALPTAIEQSLISAFSNLKFHPGKIGRRAVHSQMKIEVRLENLEN